MNLDIREFDVTNRAVISPSYGDLMWAAGFLEGEGSFRYGSKSQVIKASQTNSPEPIDFLLEIFGGSFKVYPQQGFTWAVNGIRARGVMLTLYPLLSGRRQEQIRNSLKGY